MKIRNLGPQTKKRLIILCGGILLVLLLLVVRPSATYAKATWLWDTKLIQQHSEDIVAFAKKQGVKIIFLQIGGDVKEESYREFIRKASSSGMEVHALNGKPEWALGEHREEADAFLEWVESYNENSDPEERFTGIQFDVEPYLLKDWKNDQAAVVEQWAENAGNWIEKGKEGGLEVGAAVPFWLDGIDYAGPDGEIPLNRWMVDTFDYVAIMAYRDEADRIYSAAKTTLEEGDREQKPVWIGVELGESEEGPGVSFYERSFTFLTGEINKLVRKVKGHDSFAGIAIHSYEPWREKISQWERSLKQ
ncbi:hypothetical protein V3851_01655 [Paenibacillus sp. M1]|uniref:Uncharacterized protein n=1 Tax=Paenibacillus haidiansis TaxID=1574488 RepID=A0ABU7VLC2_9BACL